MCECHYCHSHVGGVAWQRSAAWGRGPGGGRERRQAAKQRKKGKALLGKVREENCMRKMGERSIERARQEKAAAVGRARIIGKRKDRERKGRQASRGRMRAAVLL